MKKLFRSRAAKTALAPGTLVHVGTQEMEHVVISIIDYGEQDQFDERQITDLAELARFRNTPTVTWINVAGLHQVDTIQRIGQVFGLHPLLLEDILNTDQRPKMDRDSQVNYLILKMLRWLPETAEIAAEQVSLVVGKNFLLTFQERPQDVLDPLRHRLRSSQGRLRLEGADYLAYAILDTIVDHYFVILEHLGDQIEHLEEQIMEASSPDLMQTLHGLRQELLFLRKAVWPLREAISALLRGDSPLFQTTTIIYLRDVYDHTVQVIDTMETYRDLVAGLLDIYLSSVNNKMNEVMKVLTVIATIFIPLTFITSLYGMNFVHMPELQWRWGYPSLWLVLLLVTGVMLLFIKRKDWL